MAEAYAIHNGFTAWRQASSDTSREGRFCDIDCYRVYDVPEAVSSEIPSYFLKLTTATTTITAIIIVKEQQNGS